MNLGGDILLVVADTYPLLSRSTSFDETTDSPRRGACVAASEQKPECLQIKRTQHAHWQSTNSCMQAPGHCYEHRVASRVAFDLPTKRSRPVYAHEMQKLFSCFLFPP